MMGRPFDMPGGQLGNLAGAWSSRTPDAELLRLGAMLDEAWARDEAAWAEAVGVDDTPALARAQELCGLTSEIAERISSQAASTMDGLLVKARAISWCRSGEEWTAGELAELGEPATDTRLLAGLLRDLATIGGHA